MDLDIEWEGLAAVCTDVGAVADLEEPAIHQDVYLQRCASSPMVVRTTATSRNNRQIGSKRRSGQLPCKFTGKFLDSGLARDLPKGPPELGRPASAPNLGRRSILLRDPRRAALCYAEEVASGQCWKMARREKMEVPVMSAKATRSSDVREALAAGEDGPEAKRMWGELDGVGLGIGDRFELSMLMRPTPTPGRYDEADGGIARWRAQSCFPAKQPCSKYRSGVALTICADRTRARYVSRRSAAPCQDKRSGITLRPKSAPFRLIAETHGHLNMHEYIGAVMQRYDEKRKLPESPRRESKQHAPHADVSEAITEGSLAREIDNVARVPFDHGQFQYLMEKIGLPVAKYGIGTAKTLNQLWVEMAAPKHKAKTKFEALIQPDGQPKLLCSAAVVVVELCTEVEGKDIFLLLNYVLSNNGPSRSDAKTRLSSKMFANEDAVTATWRCLSDNLHLTASICKENFVIESQKEVVEDVPSEGFPGVMACYTLHVSCVRMHTKCMPTNKEFMTTLQGKNDVNSGTKRVWMWCSRALFASLYPST